MSNILKYIEDMISHESNIDSATVIFRCKNEENLGYCNLEGKIDRNKLVSYINDLIGKSQDNTQYITYQPLDGTSLEENKVAEYYNHAEARTS